MIKNNNLGNLLICELTGLDMEAAAIILDSLDAASTVVTLLALTGVGLGAAGGNNG
jgi:hypothetical protein